MSEPSSNSSATNKILIDLNNSREAQGLKKEEIIQQEALGRFKDLVDGIINRIPKFREGLKADCPYKRMRTHDVITVDGRRGSGKTTFMLSAWNVLQDDWKEDIHFLGIIDPTLVETREHIFVTIVALIKKTVEQSYKSKHANASIEGKLRDWKESLKELSTGLKLLDGIGKNPMQDDLWLDEHLALEIGLKQASSGTDLEVAFHKFVNESLEFIGKKAFLLAFDDIDTDFTKGWPVLEILRKYLTTPQVVTVLSGDLKLYSTLVEKKQLENLGLSYSSSNDSLGPHRAMVDELVDQYLLKILRTPSRIQLKGVKYYFDKYRPTESEEEASDQSLGVIVKDRSGKVKTLNNILTILCRDVLCVGARRVEQTKQVFLDLTPRALISIISGLDRACESSWTFTPESRRKGIRVLADVFLNWLDRIGYRRQNFENEDGVVAVRTLAKRLYRAELYPDGASLKPTFSDSGNDKAMCTLGGYIADVMSSTPRSYFDYMFRVSLTANVKREIANYRHLNDLTDYEKFNRYIEHVGILSDSKLNNIAARYISFMWPKKMYKAEVLALGEGTLQLLHEKRGDFKSYMAVEKEMSDWTQYLLTLPISRNATTSGSNRHFSIFNLLGKLAELLDSDEGNFDRKIRNLAFVRDYPVVEDDRSDELIVESKEEFQFDGNVDEDFIKEFMEWKQQGQSYERSIDAAILTKAWIRFLYALKDIDRSRFSNSVVGKVMHRWIVLFLNSILLEEADALGRSEIKLIHKNPTGVDDIFLKNLHKVTTDDICSNKLPFFRWIFSCPFWGCYLNPAEEVGDEPSVFKCFMDDHSDDHEGFYREMNVFDLLNQIAVVGMEGSDIEEMARRFPANRFEGYRKLHFAELNTASTKEEAVKIYKKEIAGTAIRIPRKIALWIYINQHEMVKSWKGGFSYDEALKAIKELEDSFRTSLNLWVGEDHYESPEFREFTMAALVKYVLKPLSDKTHQV
ncbi:MAG: hypothetical protein ACNI27_07850 [Desulfovibrio sp.]